MTLIENSVLHWYVSVNINYNLDLPLCCAAGIKSPLKIVTVISYTECFKRLFCLGL